MITVGRVKGRVKEIILTFINHLGKIITPLKKYYRKWALRPKIWTLLGILLAAVLLFWYPQWRVSQFWVMPALLKSDAK